MTAGRLEVDAGSGRVTGPADIVYNDPFPTHNGTPGGSGAMMGCVMHTEVGNNPGTVSWFNDPTSEASAFFCIAQSGQIAQMGPVGKDWMAWSQAAGNPHWYGIEHADNEHPETPLTTEQVTASAQLLELLSRFAGFPLQVSNDVSTEGYICHSDGGVAWGNHPDCPGSVRAAQRAEIVGLAKEIRAGVAPAPPKPDPKPPEPHVAELEGVVVVLPGGTSRKVLSSDGGKSWT
jgi:hypothetical protein